MKKNAKSTGIALPRSIGEYIARQVPLALSGTGIGDAWLAMSVLAQPPEMPSRATPNKVGRSSRAVFIFD